MHLHVAAEAAGRKPRLLAFRLPHGVPGLERKLGVDHQRRLAVRHADDAVGAAAVRKRGLELVGAHRQAVGDDRLHASLAEGAARLLVGEDCLQPDDILRERLDVVLGVVDHRQSLLQASQVFMRRTRLFGQRLGEPLRHAVEAAADRPAEFLLPPGKHVGHGRKPTLHFGLGTQQFRHPALALAHPLGLLCPSPRCPHDAQEHQHARNGGCAEQRQGRRNAEGGKTVGEALNRIHARTIAQARQD
jgi:hypothetical protein